MYIGYNEEQEALRTELRAYYEKLLTPEVREKLFWKNGQKLLGHTAVGSMHFSS